MQKDGKRRRERLSSPKLEGLSAISVPLSKDCMTLSGSVVDGCAGLGQTYPDTWEGPSHERMASCMNASELQERIQQLEDLYTDFTERFDSNRESG